MENRHPSTTDVFNMKFYPAAGWLYLKLHMELSLISFGQIQEWETAMDIASDCLYEWWMQAKNAGDLGINKQALLVELNRACEAWQGTKRRHYEAKQQFQKIFYSTDNFASNFCIDYVTAVLTYLPKLKFYEKEVIRLQLEEGLDLNQISQLLGKPLSTIKLLQDRAVYQLQKHFRPTSLPLSQLR